MKVYKSFLSWLTTYTRVIHTQDFVLSLYEEKRAFDLFILSV